MKNLIKIGIVLLLVSVTVIALQNIPQPDVQAGYTPIDKCTKITKTGNYGLTKDVSGANAPDACIILDADDITLDCKGFSVSNTPNAAGIKIAANRVTVSNCVVANNNEGIFVGGGSNNVYKNKAYNNYEYGFYLEGDSNTLTENTANENTLAGFRIDGDLNYLYKNIAFKTKQDGFYLLGNENQFYENTANENRHGGYGILGTSCEKNLFYKNTANKNWVEGFVVISCNSNSFIQNIANENGWEGFFDYDTEDNTYTENIVSKNKRAGFTIYGERGTFTKNTVSENEWSGFDIRGKQGTYKENIVKNNWDKGIDIWTGADGSVFEGNSISDNHNKETSKGPGNIVIEQGFLGKITLSNNKISGGCLLVQKSSSATVSLSNNNFCDRTPKTCTDGYKISCIGGLVTDLKGNKFVSSEQTSCSGLEPVQECGPVPITTQPQK